MRNGPMKYVLKPKSGKGQTWYTSDNIFQKYVLAFSGDNFGGWKTLVEVDNYEIIRNC